MARRKHARISSPAVFIKKLAEGVYKVEFEIEGSREIVLKGMRLD